MPYLTPDELPEDGNCRPLLIPASTEWLAILSGALTELLKPWNWEQAGTLTVDECIAAVQAIVDNYYAEQCDDCETPDGEPVERLDETGKVQQLKGGEWIEPEGDYAIPPPAARTEPTAEERKCLAAANATNVLKLMYEEVTDAYQNNLSEAFAIVQLATAVITLIAPPVGLTLSALAKLALLAWASAYAAAEFVTSDFWDTDFDDNMKCALRRCATDTAGVVTFDFNCVQQELLNQIEWIDPTLGSFALAGQVRWLLTQIGAQGLDLAGATTAIEDTDCDNCGEDWCIELLFVETGLEFLSVATGNFDGEQLYNSHNTGMGYYEGYFTGTLPYAESSLTGIEFLIGDYGMSGGWARLIAINGTNVYVEDNPIFGWHGASGLSYDMRDTLNITQMLVHDANPNTVGILGIRLRGSGYRPDYPECIE